MSTLVQIQAWFKSPPLIIEGSKKRFFELEKKHGGRLIGIGSGRSTLKNANRKGLACNGFLLPVDPWAPSIDSQSIAPQLFAFSLFPYMGFLYFITKSKSAPPLTLFGFYFLLAFVGATIPAGIYAKVHYGTSLSNVDWLHGGAESLLTLTNIFIVLGLREALRKTGDGDGDGDEITSNSSPLDANEDDKPSI